MVTKCSFVTYFYYDYYSSNKEKQSPFKISEISLCFRINFIKYTGV